MSTGWKLLNIFIAHCNFGGEITLFFKKSKTKYILLEQLLLWKPNGNNSSEYNVPPHCHNKPRLLALLPHDFHKMDDWLITLTNHGQLLIRHRQVPQMLGLYLRQKTYLELTFWNLDVFPKRTTKQDLHGNRSRGVPQVVQYAFWGHFGPLSVLEIRQNWLNLRRTGPVETTHKTLNWLHNWHSGDDKVLAAQYTQTTH